MFLTDNPGWLRSGLTGLCVADGESRNPVHMASRGLTMTAFGLSATAVVRARDPARRRAVSVDFNQSDWSGWDLGS